MFIGTGRRGMCNYALSSREGPRVVCSTLLYIRGEEMNDVSVCDVFCSVLPCAFVCCAGGLLVCFVNFGVEIRSEVEGSEVVQLLELGPCRENS